MSQLTNMQHMFYDASAFNGPVDWCVLDSVVTDIIIRDMFRQTVCWSAHGCGLMVAGTCSYFVAACAPITRTAPKKRLRTIVGA